MTIWKVLSKCNDCIQLKQNWRSIAHGLKVSQAQLAEITAKISSLTPGKNRMDHNALYLVLYHWTKGLRTTTSLVELVETLKRLGHADAEGIKIKF